MNTLFKIYAQAQDAGRRNDLDTLAHLLRAYPALDGRIRSYYALGLDTRRG